AHAAVPAMAVRDTYKRVRGGVVVETVPREGLVELLGPWIFERGALEGAMARVRVGGSGQPCRSAVDLCRLAGVSVRLLRWPATALAPSSSPRARGGAWEPAGTRPCCRL